MAVVSVSPCRGLYDPRTAWKSQDDGRHALDSVSRAMGGAGHVAAEANGVVAVEGDRIEYVGPASEAPPGDDDDLGDVVLMPGLVNAHCHLELTAMRGFLEDLDFAGGSSVSTSARRRSSIATHYWTRRGTESRKGVRRDHDLRRYVRFGGRAYRRCVRRASAASMYQEVFGPDPAHCAKAIADLREKVAGLRYLETPLVRVGVSPHAPYTVSDDLFQRDGESRASRGFRWRSTSPRAISRRSS